MVRNLLLRAWLNEPFPWWILSTGNTIGKCLVKGARAGNLRHVLWGLGSAIREIPRAMRLRRPISSKTIWVYLALRRTKITSASMVQQVYQAPPRSVRNLFA